MPICAVTNKNELIVPATKTPTLFATIFAPLRPKAPKF